MPWGKGFIATEKEFLWESQRKFSPLDTTTNVNCYNYGGDTARMFFPGNPKPNLFEFLLCFSKFISKLRRANTAITKTLKINTHQKWSHDWFVQPKLKREICWKLGLRTIDSHECRRVDAYLTWSDRIYHWPHPLVAPKKKRLPRNWTFLLKSYNSTAVF